MRLACPHCGGPLSAALEYTGLAYSEHRDWTGTECDDCGKEWNTAGDLTSSGFGWPLTRSERRRLGV